MTDEREIRAALVGPTAERIAKRIQDASNQFRKAINDQDPVSAIRHVLTILHASEELAALTHTRVVLAKGSP